MNGKQTIEKGLFRVSYSVSSHFIDVPLKEDQRKEDNLFSHMTSFDARDKQ